MSKEESKAQSRKHLLPKTVVLNWGVGVGGDFYPSGDVWPGLEGGTDIYWPEARDAATHSGMHRTAPTTVTQLQNANCAKVEKP